MGPSKRRVVVLVLPFIETRIWWPHSVYQLMHLMPRDVNLLAHPWSHFYYQDCLFAMYSFSGIVYISANWWIAVLTPQISSCITVWNYLEMVWNLCFILLHGYLENLIKYVILWQEMQLFRRILSFGCVLSGQRFMSGFGREFFKSSSMNLANCGILDSFIVSFLCWSTLMGDWCFIVGVCVSLQ